MLSCCGAALGLILAVTGTSALSHLDAVSIPLLESVRVDAGALGFTLAIAVLTGVMFGLVPALQVPAIAARAKAKHTLGFAARWSYRRLPSLACSSIPGIDAAGLTDVPPLVGDRSWGVAAKGQIYPKDQYPEAYIRIVSDGYLAAMGIPLRAGRDLTERDTPASDNVVLINETMARRLWAGQNAIGQVVTQDGGRRVAGIVGDVRHGAVEDVAAGPEMYIALRQTHRHVFCCRLSGWRPWGYRWEPPLPGYRRERSAVPCSE